MDFVHACSSNKKWNSLIGLQGAGTTSLVNVIAKSFERLKPDMFIVLGDVSARGSELTNNKWLSVLQQFHWMLGPFLSLPMHIVVGDRDIGECSKLNAKFVSRIASSLAGLDSAGCGAFEVSKISFVSLAGMNSPCNLILSGRTTNTCHHMLIEEFAIFTCFMGWPTSSLGCKVLIQEVGEDERDIHLRAAALQALSSLVAYQTLSCMSCS